MFSLLCLDCIKGDGTLLDSIIIQRGRYILASFCSILLSHTGSLDRFLGDSKTLKGTHEMVISSWLFPFSFPKDCSLPGKASPTNSCFQLLASFRERQAEAESGCRVVECDAD